MGGVFICFSSTTPFFRKPVGGFVDISAEVNIINVAIVILVLIMTYRISKKSEKVVLSTIVKKLDGFFSKVEKKQKEDKSLESFAEYLKKAKIRKFAKESAARYIRKREIKRALLKNKKRYVGMTSHDSRIRKRALEQQRGKVLLNFQVEMSGLTYYEALE